MHTHFVVIAAGMLFAAASIGCGPSLVSDGLADYRAAIEERLATTQTPSRAAGSTYSPDEELVRLPRRRLRRIEVGDQRIGPFDFLAILGCPLSEVVARRNSSLGRVLIPTRRLEHEVSVLNAAEDCLPSLRDDRAQRLRERIAAKRLDFGAHVWNAVWLSEEIERFVTAGPRSIIGGRDADDAPWQLKRAAAAIAPQATDRIDLEVLAEAFEQLRDDPAMGPLIREIDRARFELLLVAAMIAKVEQAGCDATKSRLAGDFERRYLPLQRRLGALDRRAESLLGALDRLYRVSSASVEVPAAMQRFAAATLDVESSQGLWMRYRAAVGAHASAWQPLLEACGHLPGETSRPDENVSFRNGREREDA